MSGRVELEVVEGPIQGARFAFVEHDTFLFGRMRDCHARLRHDPMVSRHHFLVEANPPQATVRDLGSLNGTWVNGEKIGGRERGETAEEGALREFPEVDLGDRDLVRVGHTILRVRIAKGEGAGTPVRCQACGRDAMEETGGARAGDYVCEHCREDAQTDPSQMLALLGASSAADTQAGWAFPGYEIVRKLGRGGYGSVYLVRKVETGELSALKVMLSRVAVEPLWRRRFLQEIELMRGLRHENLVELLDSGSRGGAFYFLMEYCEGGSLAELVRKSGGKLALHEVGPIMLQALEGLAFAHRQGIVHRDMKPGNILLETAGRGYTAKVTDLGLAKNFDLAGLSGMTVTGSTAGTPQFMPREQVVNFKYMRPASDVWSTAATLYIALTGRYPRDERPGVSALEEALRASVVPIRDRNQAIPEQVARVIDRALDTDEHRRYQDAAEFRDALAKVLP